MIYIFTSHKLQVKFLLLNSGVSGDSDSIPIKKDLGIHSQKVIIVMLKKFFCVPTVPIATDD